MKKVVIIVAQILLLLCINEFGYFLAKTFDMPIPGNVLGMVILFVLLMTNIISLKWVEAASGFLIKHLAFFFVPIAVGLMTFGSLMLQSGLFLLIVIVGSAALGIFITGSVSQALAEGKEGVGDGRSRHSA